MATARWRHAFSLIEVLVAVAILMVGAVVLANVVHVGRRHTEAAEGYTTAAMLCSSKLEEIACGASPAQAVDDAAFPDDSGWHYSVSVQPSNLYGLSTVTVTVWWQDPNKSISTTAETDRKYRVSLTRLLQIASSNTSSQTDTQLDQSSGGASTLLAPEIPGL